MTYLYNPLNINDLLYYYIFSMLWTNSWKQMKFIYINYTPKYIWHETHRISRYLNSLIKKARYSVILFVISMFYFHIDGFKFYLHNNVVLQKYTLWYRYMSSSHKLLTLQFLYTVHYGHMVHRRQRCLKRNIHYFFNSLLIEVIKTLMINIHVWYLQTNLEDNQLNYRQSILLYSRTFLGDIMHVESGSTVHWTGKIYLTLGLLVII